ncbi:MAG TPA: chromosome segregation protein SMC [Planctomycetes bacterium]|nr:chromosome segregation protein SMC [Planctomycetota bacterium]
MRLKRLELFGFKSFADRSVLDFRQDLTGIVGPNGCGKSNVVDAVRWILGEQRPSSMRGGEMTDVIFKGSSSRPVMSVAEGTIVFDNSSGTLEDRGDEVSVTRRVYRSGEGEYLIDGVRVRLKDVREMLFGTGLGSRGYSVLEQGKIDAILSANALERRAIFEEAAGVSRYRQRRKETESRLRRVQADLVRLEDVVGELAKRERSLKVQAGRARRFVETRDAWRLDGTRLAKHQLHNLADEMQATRTLLAEAEAEVEARRADRASAEEELAERARELEALRAELSRTSGESSELAAEVRGIDERRKELLSRVEAWRASAEEESARIVVLEERRRERGEESAALEAELQGVEASHSEAVERAELLAKETAELANSHREVARASEAKNQEVLRSLHELTSARNRVQHLADSLEPLAEREERAELRLEAAREEWNAAREEEVRAREALAAAEAALAEAEEARDACAREGDQLDRRLEELEARRVDLEVEGARLSSRVESLRDWERERESLGAGARELLDAIERGEGPELAGRLSGLLADHLHADTRVARALDAALGNRARALVVEGPADAARILEWLKERQGGRVRLALPVRNGHGSDEAEEREVRELAGVEGPLLEKTRADAGFEGVAAALIDDVWLVADAAAAETALERFPRLRFVTPDGDLFAAGAVEGGHIEVAQGAVGRRSQADELEARGVAVREELDALAGELEAARARRADGAEKLARCGEQVRECSAERSSLAGALDAVRARINELVRAVEFSERECEGLAHERDGVAAELEQWRERLGELEVTHSREEKRLGELEEERKALEAVRGQRARDEGQARAELSGLRERLEFLSRRRTDLARQVEELGQEMERVRERSKRHLEDADRGQAEAESLAATRDEHLARRGELEERLQTLRAAEAKGREGLEELRRRADAITQDLEAALERVSRTGLDSQRVELAREELARRAEEDFGSSAAELLEGFEPEEELADPERLSELERRVAELKRTLDRLGPVNLEAVEELEEVSGRLEFLTTQKGDLDEARRSLEATIRRLDEESERRFVEAFDAIRAEFRVLFRQLFGGGKADVSLQEGVSVLEAGIEIIARPPGRESLPISLLSGGQRTLTALALLFAVFRTNSSPFCILDEVDAALDEANIGRFLSMVQSSLGETQYIIVTHNKGTMAACQVLYGVTMAVKGVSHVVSVELDQVDEFVPEVVGSSKPSPLAEATPDPAAEEDLREVEVVPRASGGAPVETEAEAEPEAEDAPELQTDATG